MPPRNSSLRILAGLTLAIIYVAGAYSYGQRRNPTHINSDQNAYLNEIRQLRDTHYTHLTERSRMPLYLYLQSFAAREGMTNSELFPRAKLLNLAVSFIALLAIYKILLRLLPRLAAENLLLITAFTVFAFRAAFVYAELLYYALFFIAMVLMLVTFYRPHPMVAAVAGFVLALAHLTKASTLPALILFLLVHTLFALLTRANLLRKLAICAAIVLTYLATLGPYLLNSKQSFGQYFYNVNTTFYLWCDSWLEVCSGPKAHGDRFHWPAMPADQIPSFSKYLHDHGLAHIAVMTAIGVYKLLAEARNSSGFAKFFAIYAGFTLWSIYSNRAAFRRWLAHPPNAAATAFLLACCGVYFFAIAFYLKITQPGMRFLLALFLPAMLGMCWLLSREPFRSDKFHRAIRWLFIANLLISLIPRLLVYHH